MRRLRTMLTRHAAATQQVPPPITLAEKAELARATTRITRKWTAFDKLVEDYREQDRLRTKLGHHT